MDILKKTEEFCISRFAGLDAKQFVYHNLNHTKEVVDACKLIGEKSGLTDEELDLVQIAAWFHDIGYMVDYQNHEEESRRIASKFLLAGGMEPEKINIITGCIDATKIPQSPKSKLEEVICDADMFHLSLSNFCERTILLNVEKNMFNKDQIAPVDFYQESIRFLELPYFTEYASQTFENAKKMNAREVTAKIALHQAEKEIIEQKLDAESYLKELKKKTRKLKKGLDQKAVFSRGVDTMFRTTSRKQINLSAIADNKSNIMITMNTLIVSVVITLFVRRYQDYPYLIIPVLILIVTCLSSLIAAILSTRPIMLKGEFTEEDLLNRRVNLLFFGNFFNTAFKEYEKAMKEMMQDDNHLYSVMIMDQYSQGKVLAKKFRLLRIAYDIFMYGFILFIITCTLAMILYSRPSA